MSNPYADEETDTAAHETHSHKPVHRDVAALVMDDAGSVDHEHHITSGASTPQNIPSPASGLKRSFSSFGRPRWDSPREMTLMLMGYAIGIGNLWRFPYLVGRYGGGAFLIPYLLCLVFVAAPLFLLEMIFGQKMQRGAIEAFRKLHGSLSGIGYTCFMLLVILEVYYNVVVGYAFYFIVESFHKTLPWISRSHTYFDEEVLRSVPITDEGTYSIVWPLVCSTAGIWFLLWLGTIRGVKGGGKVAYITVNAPFVLILIMLVRCVLLPGAMDGIAFYLTPRPKELMDPSIWALACGQILFSLSPCMGTPITLAGYNDYNDDILKTTLIVVLTNSLFSFVTGFVVFSVVGYMAQSTGLAITEIAASGPKLAFIVFPEAIGTLPMPHVFSLLFFLTVLLLGIDSALASVEGLNTMIADKFRARGKKPPKEALVATVTVLFGCAAGLLFCTRGGTYWVDIVDHYLCTYVLLAVAVVEPICLHKFYGFGKFKMDCLDMTGKQVPKVLYIGWFVAPVAAVALLLSIIVSDIKEPHGGYPWWAQMVGVGTVVAPLCCIPFSAAKWYFKQKNVEDSHKRPETFSKKTGEYSEISIG